MKKIIIIINNTIKIKNLPNKYIESLNNILIINNPKHLENIKYNRSNYKTPRTLKFINNNSESIITPRGFLSSLKKILKKENLDYKIKYQTISNPLLTPIESKIKNRDYAKEAIKKILKKRTGVLQAPTGSGKTIIGIETIAKRKQSTLIIVHTKELLYQWRERLIEFTDLEENDIGLIGDGKKDIKPITIGIINSLVKMKSNIPSGYIIVDECHRTPSTSFTKFLVKQNPKYILGLSATPYRRDGLDKLIEFFIGNTTYKIKTKELQKQGHILKADLKIIKTDFNPYIVDISDYQKTIKKLTEDEDRNNIIIESVMEESKNFGTILIISDRKSHCRKLYDKLLLKILDPVCLITGSTPDKQRQKIIEEIKTGAIKVIIATSQLIGEGFDEKHISSIFLCTPIKYEGRLIQYIGRILRKADGKEKATIFDFEDPCWILKNSFNKRLKSYKKLEIKEIRK